MSRGKYLTIVGYVELVGSIIYGIVMFISLIISSAKGAVVFCIAMVQGQPAGSAVVGWAIFLDWVLFIVSLFFLPSIGILFITVGDHESRFIAEERVDVAQKKQNKEQNKEQNKRIVYTPVSREQTPSPTFAAGANVRLKNDLPLSGGDILPKGTIGVVDTENTKGEPKILFRFEGRRILIRLKAELLENAE